jgi:hypothetical protein
VICPHCSADLKRKQRYGRRCSTCRKTFALEPKENSLHLHDLRVRRLAAVLADPLRPEAAALRYTADQLRLAASRNALANPSEMSGWLRFAGFVAIVGGMIGLFGLLTESAETLIAAFFGVVGVYILCLIGHTATAGQRAFAGEPMSPGEFASQMRRWEEVYGEPPPGLLTSQAPAGDVWPSRPAVALLYCPDAGTSAFLVASGIVERRGVAVINQEPALQSAVRAHPALPVYVLHPADPVGCMAVPRLRAALPPGTRVIDAGLRPRVAARAGPPVRIRPDPEVLHELARTGAVDADEQAWLVEGKTFPLAAVRPARLLMAVERAVTQVDPEERRAAAVGFMAWPERVG